MSELVALFGFGAGVMLAACSGSSATQAPASGQASAGGQIIVGLITKTETNPFFVKMKEGALQAAAANGVKLLTGAGKNDADNAALGAYIHALPPIAGNPKHKTC